jgi:thiol-disulfide isomerase/thioredoxin
MPLLSVLRLFAVAFVLSAAHAAERPLAPNFQAYDSQGVRRKLSEFRGKVVLLNFWSTWCPPCTAEIPALNKVYRDYGARGFIVVAVAMDERGWAAVTPFVTQFRMDYPVLLGNGRLARLYGGLKSSPLDHAHRPQPRDLARQPALWTTSITSSTSL